MRKHVIIMRKQISIVLSAQAEVPRQYLCLALI